MRSAHSPLFNETQRVGNPEKRKWIITNSSADWHEVFFFLIICDIHSRQQNVPHALNWSTYFMGRKNLWKAERPTDCCIYLHALHTHAAFKQHALTLCTQWILQFSIASKKYVKEQSSLFSRYRLEHLIDFSTFFSFLWHNVPIEANLVSQLSIQKALRQFSQNLPHDKFLILHWLTKRNYTVENADIHISHEQL